MLKRPLMAAMVALVCLVLAFASGVQAQSPSAAPESPGLPSPTAEATTPPAASPTAEASASVGPESPAPSAAATPAPASESPSAAPTAVASGSPGTESPPTESPVAPAAESPAASAVAGLPPNCTVVANNLLNPRGLAFGPDGTLYIAEAGSGGTTPDFADNPVPGASFPAASTAPGEPAAGSPAPASGAPNASGEPQVTTHGDTGQVTAVYPDGTTSVIAKFLTSYVFGDEVVGPSKVAVTQDGTIYVSIGGPGPGTSFFEPAENADSVVKVSGDGTVSQVANIGQYERANNPDPYPVDSDVGGMAVGADGLLYVADSGGNDLYSVDPSTGTLKVVAVIPALAGPQGLQNPDRGNTATVDPVPTDVIADPNGGVWVGMLSGGILWGTPGATKVVHVAADGTVTDAVTGLDMVVGLARGNGGLFVSELSTNLLATPPAPGRIMWVPDGGAPQVAVDGLMVPYGIALAPDGNSLYIAVNASTPAGTPAAGQVLKCTISMPPAASAAPTAGQPSEAPSASAAPPSMAPTAAPSGSPAPSVAATESPLPSVAPSESPLPSASVAPSVEPSTSPMSEAPSVPASPAASSGG
jgi:sugar lactone lactonase YvrE